MDSKEIQYIDTAIALFKSKNPGCTMSFIDIGANHGKYSEQFFNQAKLKNQPVHIYMVEPIEELHFKSLVEKAKHMGAKTFCYGISSVESDSYPMHVIKSDNEDEIGLSSFHDRPVFAGYKKDTKAIKTISLDNFIERVIDKESIDFVKIDVEGSELDVLKSAERSLQQKKIKVIQFEYGGTYKDSGITLGEVIKYLNQFGYDVYDFQVGEFVKINHVFIEDFQYDNFLAISKNLC